MTNLAGKRKDSPVALAPPARPRLSRQSPAAVFDCPQCPVFSGHAPPASP